MIVLGLSLCLFSARGQAVQSYLETIKPLLRERCYACHGSLKQKAGLRLDTVELIQSQNRDTPILDFNHPEQSLLLKRLRSTDLEERMPPEGKPVEASILSVIEDWIAQGAPAPPDEAPEASPSDHWAFRPPRTPDALMGGEHPIDELINGFHTSMQLTPTQQAPPLLLMRRLYLDLVGYLPRQDEILEYLKDPSEQHYLAVVDRLLASPAHGERWGRHWMDIWRYSDWFGLGDQLRYSQKHIWHWRDWIIESLNLDKGYDLMILEMLAADELYPTDEDRLRANGFLARNYFLFNRTTWLDKTIEHTSRAFLGLTMQCSKCHDHKYDPITAEDYYRFRAILEPHQIRTDTVSGEMDLEKNGIPRAFDMHPEAKTYLHRRGNEKDVDTTQSILPGPPAFLGDIPFDIQPVQLPPEAVFPALRGHVLETLLNQAALRLASIEQSRHELAPESNPLLDLEWEAASKHGPALRAIHAAMHYRATQPDGPEQGTVDQHAAKASLAYDIAQIKWELATKQEALARAEKDKQEPLVKAIKALEEAQQARELAYTDNPHHFVALRASIKALESPAETATERAAAYPRDSTGRRTALAKWLVHQDNPLTARVAVNHIWSRHFGMPIVDPPTDFGRRTPAPALQDVLDYLATFLTQHSWKMKPLHRLIVTSQAYRRSSSSLETMEDNTSKDPENHWLWRQHPKRMESQVIRDSLLHLGGLLDTKIGGPSLPADQTHARRSLYFRHSRDDQERFLTLFDDASILECYRRSESIIPQQALALSNSQLSMDAAKAISKGLLTRHDKRAMSDAWFVEQAFVQLLGWSPTEQERTLCEESLKHWRGTAEQEDQSITPEASLIHTLINHNDFVTIR